MLAYHGMTKSDWTDLDGDDENKQLLIDDFMQSRKKVSQKKLSVQKDFDQMGPKDIAKIIIDGRDNESDMNGKKNLDIFLTVAKTALKGTIDVKDYYRKIVCQVKPEDDVELAAAKKKLAAAKEFDDQDRITEWDAKVKAFQVKIDMCPPFAKLSKDDREKYTTESKDYTKKFLFPTNENDSNIFLSQYTKQELIKLLKALRKSEMYGDYKKFPISESLRKYEETLKGEEEDRKEACMSVVSNTLQAAFVNGDVGEIDQSDKSVLAKLLDASIGFIDKIASNKYVLENLFKCQELTDEELEVMQEEDDAQLPADDEIGAKLIGFFGALFNGTSASPKYEIGKFSADQWNKLTKAAAAGVDGIEGAKIATLETLRELGITELERKDKVKEVKERLAAAEKKAVEQVLMKQAREAKAALKKKIQEALVRNASESDLTALTEDQAMLKEILAEERTKLSEKEAKAAAKKEQKEQFKGWPRGCSTEMDEEGKCPDGYDHKYRYSNKSDDECCFTISEDEFKTLVKSQQEFKEKTDADSQAKLKDINLAIKHARVLTKRRVNKKPELPPPQESLATKESGKHLATKESGKHLATKEPGKKQRMPKEEKEKLMAALVETCKAKNIFISISDKKKAWDHPKIVDLRTKCGFDEAADIIEQAIKAEAAAIKSSAEAVVSRSPEKIASANQLANEAEQKLAAAALAIKKLTSGKPAIRGVVTGCRTFTKVGCEKHTDVCKWDGKMCEPKYSSKGKEEMETPPVREEQKRKSSEHRNEEHRNEEHTIKEKRLSPFTMAFEGPKGKQAAKLKKLAAMQLMEAANKPLKRSPEYQVTKSLYEEKRENRKAFMEEETTKIVKGKDPKVIYSTCHKLFADWLINKGGKMSIVNGFLTKILPQLITFYKMNHLSAKACFDDKKFRKQIEVIAMLKKIIPEA